MTKYHVADNEVVENGKTKDGDEKKKEDPPKTVSAFRLVGDGLLWIWPFDFKICSR